MTPSVAIVGIACLYPDARSPVELWENVLAQRLAFRRMPDERLCAEDYLSTDRNAADCTYSAEAALIEGYEFDRVRFQVVGSTFRSADLAHWVALDVAASALSDAGFGQGEDLPRDSTGVFLGNTLTGEFSRANLMRLRWPYVRRVLETALAEENWSAEKRRLFIGELENSYKKPFPPIGEESLAGSLSNTIAGRVCNYFDLKGGGYTVDGACASSLLAVTTACSSLVAGDVDVALAGGVDLSLDPFELVGFAKAGALADEKMRVYDAHSAGFWPGEGCGFVVLMRHEDALAQHRRIYATVKGWGTSSDGSGGITRPSVEGQLLALSRAYRRAGFGIETITYFEGHGTGTSVGDATELKVLSDARRRAAAPDLHPAAIGSVKANIGHTKAAAGVAGLIKATMALHTQLLPPTTGCEEPHQELTCATPALRVLSEGESWPTDGPLRAGVSAMGFGGINTHVVLEADASERRRMLSPEDKLLLSSAQDAELLLLGARNADDLERQVESLLAFASKLSHAEVADLSAQLGRTLGSCRLRAAIVASSPAQLEERLETLRSWLKDGAATRLDLRAGLFLGVGDGEARLGFLFPGQGSPTYLGGGAFERRFGLVRELYARSGLPPAVGQSIATSVAQPAIVTASLAALRLLYQLGIRARLAVGHSLGEFTALHWAGAMDEDSLLRIVKARGRAMAELCGQTGAMASIGAGHQEVEGLLNGRTGERVVIASFNSRHQTVVSGEATAVAKVLARARAKGLRAIALPVSHAFHSPLVEAAVPALALHLSLEEFQPLRRTVVSTITGNVLTPNDDLPTLLCRQVTSPVRFAESMIAAADEVDLWIEVGPGRVLSGLLTEFGDTPAVALDAGGPSLRGLWRAVGASFALGARINQESLLNGRFTRPFDLNWRPRFFVNPCELPPHSEGAVRRARAATIVPEKAEALVAEAVAVEAPSPPSPPLAASALDLVRRLVAERAELPSSAVKDTSRLLNDLHLNSITVGQLVAEAARQLGLPPPAAPTDYADATVAGVASALEDLARTGQAGSVKEAERLPAGVDSWIRTFTVELVERPLQHRVVGVDAGVWRVIAAPDNALAGPLKEAFDHWGEGHGVVVCLPPGPDERHIGLLLEGVRTVLEMKAARFVLVQHGGGAASFARTLHLEMPEVVTCVVDLPVDHPQSAQLVVEEARLANGYAEAHYDGAGRRREPVLRLLSLPEQAAEPALGPDDVLLVTGGGKGIAAECALSLSGETGVRLVLLGRSQPSMDVELAANLERMSVAGIPFKYIAADVADLEAVSSAVREAEKEFGPVTAILHGAGTNVPRLLNSIDEAALLRTLAPKVQGLRNVLAAVNPDGLRLLVTFGSIIARAGMRGEADYALANEWLARLTEQFQSQHPACRCLAVEWSVWSGVGMGERLGRVDALVREGIMPIAADEGQAVLRRLIAQPLREVSVVVAGRFGETPTLRLEKQELPFLRFLEQPRVFYPGIELVVDAELSSDADPYVEDHVFQGARLFPAVMGLEAMAQVSMALLDIKEPPVFEDVTLSRPVIVAENSTRTIRLAALVRGPDSVEVALRSDETSFQVDHFRAVCRFGIHGSTAQARTESSQPSPSEVAELMPVGLNPDRDLYGEILFHQGRFRRLRSYKLLRATECLAEIAPSESTDWFGHYLPGGLLLGDPGARDAAIHAVQACIPHATLFPMGVDRLTLDVEPSGQPRFVYARERSREGDTFTYDLEVSGEDGCVRERWEGLRLRVVDHRAGAGSWVEPLLGPYVERRIKELVPGSTVSVLMERNPGGERPLSSDRAIQRALGTAAPIRRRPDGKPEVIGEPQIEVSAAHTADLTFVVAGPGPLGCDIEHAMARPVSIWRELLGHDRFALAEVISHHAGEDETAAATRVWAASECLKKAGASLNAPLTLASSEGGGWVKLSAGPLVVATLVTQVRDVQKPLALAVLLSGSNGGQQVRW